MAGFREIIGQEKIVEHFRNAIRYDKISHAYILTGEQGMGKKMIAEAFAMTVQCENGADEPCMSCHSCKQAMSGNNPDIRWVKHEKPATISVEDIRMQVNNDIVIKPYEYKRKIYIIDEAEKMTAASQNALLKTIEEPPGYAVILLLTTNQEAFLPTILSRCVQLKLKPLRDFTVKKYLMDTLHVEESDADIYAAFARGNLGKAISLASSEDFKLLHGEMLHLLKHVKEMDISELLDYIRKMKEENLDIYECLDFMQLWYRDVLLYKVARDMNQLIFKDEYSSINGIGQKCSYEGLEKILEAIDKARVRLDANVNMELAMELMLLVMKEQIDRRREP